MLSALLIGCGQQGAPSNNMNSGDKPPIVSVLSDDSEMQGAMKAARDSFPEFWREVSLDYQRPIPVLDGVMVKAYFSDRDKPEGGEHMWVHGVHYDGKAISGTLASQPRHVASVKPGEPVSFPLDRLSDWLHVEDDMAKGAFTVRLLRSRMSVEDRRAHDSHYPFRFD